MEWICHWIKKLVLTCSGESAYNAFRNSLYVINRNFALFFIAVVCIYNYSLSDEVIGWLSFWSEVQIICIWSSWCHCHPIVSCFMKIQIGLTFLVQAYSGCPGKRPLNWCLSAMFIIFIVFTCRFKNILLIFLYKLFVYMLFIVCIIM